MTREKTIDLLNGMVDGALRMAIRSLEMWDKVMEEIDDIDVLLFDDRNEVKEECKYIIKKYLKEVEDEQVH